MNDREATWPSQADLRAALARYAVMLDRVSEAAVEDAIWFPPLRSVYWRLARANRGYPPDETLYAQYILSLCGPKMRDQWRRAILARAYRAWLSLVREQDFLPTLQRYFADVRGGPSGSDELDMRRGIDFVIRSAGRPYGVGLTVATPRADRYNGRKGERHPPRSIPYTLLRLPLNPEGADVIETRGEPIYLFPERAAEALQTWIARESVKATPAAVDWPVLHYGITS